MFDIFVLALLPSSIWFDRFLCGVVFPLNAEICLFGEGASSEKIYLKELFLNALPVAICLH